MVAPLDREGKKYLQRVKNVLTSNLCTFRTNQGPTQLLDHLYIGSKEDAHKIRLLHTLKITHVLNCAGKKDYDDENCFKSPYDGTGIKYLQFEARDNDGYPMLMHFQEAKSFIDGAKREKGRVLVHCEMGINRSGCICIAYMMADENITLLNALRRAKMERPVILVNEGFQALLIQFGQEQNLLYDGGRLSRRRSSSMPKLDQIKHLNEMFCRAATPT